MRKLGLTLIGLCLGLFAVHAQTPSPATNLKVERDPRAVTVTMPDHTYVIRQRIDLAPAQFFVLEFPTEDELWIVSPHNLSLLHLDEALVKQKNPKLPVVVRAGAHWKENSEPTYITVYMASGAFLQLDVFATKEVSKSADRISWRYNPSNVRRARELSLQTQPVSKEVTEPKAGPLAINASPSDGPVVTDAKFAIEKGMDKETGSSPKRKEIEEESKAKEIADNALITAINFQPPKKDKLYKNREFLLFGLPSRWANGGVWTVSVVGVKNKTGHSLQLTGVPYLQIETKGKKGDNLNVEPLKPLAIRTTAQNAPIIFSPGAVIYFSFVYRTPLLGVNQSLSFAVSNTNAADAPVTFNLRPGASF